MKLIKLSDTHYIIVDDSEIKEGDLVRWSKDFNVGQTVDSINKDWSEWKKITHSTEPLENVKTISLSEVEEVIYGYSVEKMAKNEFPVDKYQQDWAFRRMGFVKGFKAHQELVKDKMFTVEDIRKAMFEVYKNGIRSSKEGKESFSEISNRIIQSLLPKTEWLIEFDEQGKITLL